MAEDLIEVRIPSRMADGFDGWFEGTGVMQGDEDGDAEMLALKKAWLGQKRVKRGGGHSVVLMADRHTLDILKDYTGYCLTANSDESELAQVQGARAVADAIDQAYARVRLAQGSA
jgi:hypothetical protein